MSETEYRIEYSIQRKRAEDGDFIEVGFGSSCSYEDIEGALYYIESDIQNLNWEHEGDQPTPEEVDAEIREALDDE